MNTQEILMNSLSSNPINLSEVQKKHPEITLDDLQIVAWDLIDRQIVHMDGNWKLSIPQKVEQVVN
jgi:hypothetical protein